MRPGFQAWRDYTDEAVRGGWSEICREFLRPEEVPMQARALYERGARRVKLERPVDLSCTDGADLACTQLEFVRELTGLGVVVDWELALGGGEATVFELCHLFPPNRIWDGGSKTGDELADWCKEFYFGKCMYRHGPGFIQVRDRRRQKLELFTIEDPAYLSVIKKLGSGCPRAGLPNDVIDSLEAEHLACVIGDWRWWAPFRCRRWPVPAMRL